MNDPPKPACSLKELKINNPTAYEVFQIIIKGLIQKYWRNPAFRNLGIGLEGTLEATEELIEKGYLKINLDNDNFYFLIWEPIKGEYVKPPF